MWLAIEESGRQALLLKKIKTVFERAIDARSPKNRPPGKAGLRAEKGYYRLLYLEGDVNKQIFSSKKVPSSWEQMAAILRQLQDIPELQEEIRIGIEAALRKLSVKPF
jgi:hypothetical protein